jgi:SAM-dependent methyltransferase
MPDIKRYEHFGWDYDHFNPHDERAEAWYLTHLEQTGGPVLELACGGGKLLEAIARAGHEVVGLDLSAAMLGRARRRIASLPLEVAARISLVRGDMSDFDLGREFGAVVLADNSFREVETREALHACLRCIRRHLREGGLLLLTERRFDPDLYPDGRGDWPWTESIENPETGERMRRRVTVLVRDGWSEGTFHYEVTAPDGTVRRETCPWVSPIVTPDEYGEMLRRTGFRWRLFTGYEEKPDDGSDRMLCFVAEPV